MDTKEVPVSSTLVRSSTNARDNFSTVLDEAAEGAATVIERRRQRVVVVDQARFLAAIEPSLPTPVAVPEDDGWSLMLPGLPVAAEGPTFDDAINEFVDALVEYAEDWEARLRTAPNHAANWPLVQFILLSSREALRDWVIRVPE
ncbi:MAG: prevent-host-death protein [Actinomycetota bacterium]|nr:prevent-host-death protein [Actinomycetota bacterium]